MVANGLNMIEQGQIAPSGLAHEPGKPALLVFFETDCPTCQLALPYLNALAKAPIRLMGISQDDEASTREFVRQLNLAFPVQVDHELRLSRAYDPQSVPTLFLLDEAGQVLRTLAGFDKAGLNKLAADLGQPAIAPEHDGAPSWKPGCSSRHLEPEPGNGSAHAKPQFLRTSTDRATRVTLSDKEDPFDYCAREFGDALPVVPPT